MNPIVLLVINTLCLHPQHCVDFYMRCQANTVGTAYEFNQIQKDFLCASELFDELNVDYKWEIKREVRN